MGGHIKCPKKLSKRGRRQKPQKRQKKKRQSSIDRSIGRVSHQNLHFLRRDLGSALIPAILGTGVGVIAKALLQIATEHIVRADEAERTLAQARMTHTDRPS
jgi:hypothetical protein